MDADWGSRVGVKKNFTLVSAKHTHTLSYPNTQIHTHTHTHTHTHPHTLKHTKIHPYIYSRVSNR